MLSAPRLRPVIPPDVPASRSAAPAAASPAAVRRVQPWLLPLYVIAGAALGVLGQLILEIDRPPGTPGIGPYFTDLWTRVPTPTSEVLQLPLLMAGAALCLAALLLVVPSAHVALIRRVDPRRLLQAVLLFSAAYGLTHFQLNEDLRTSGLLAAVLCGVVIGPLTVLTGAVAALSVLAGHIAALGWQPPTPLTAGALAAAGALASTVALRARSGGAQAAPALSVALLTTPAADTDSGTDVARAVLDAADGFIAAFRPSDIADRIAEDTNIHLHAAGTILLLWDENLESFRVGAIGGRHALSGAELRQVEVPPDCVPTLRAAAAGQVLDVDTASVREPMLNSLLRRWKADTLLGVRLEWGERMLGLLFVARTRHAGGFTARDREVLAGIGLHAAAGLAHVNLIADLQSSNQLKEEFMATMSHELRTPLNVIIGYTDLQLDGAFGDLNGDHQDTLQRVRDQALQLLALIQATLDTSRLERGLVTAELTDVAVPALIESLKAQLPSSWRKPTVELNWRVPTALPTIRTDPGKLQIILRNLIHNALKFTHHGLVTVAVLQHPAKEQLSFVVQDSGVGIKAEHLSQIFEMFRQAPGGDGNNQGGVGLGLYIVKRLAALLGAEIDVSSAPDRGATFRIHVPIAGPSAPPRRT